MKEEIKAVPVTFSDCKLLFKDMSKKDKVKLSKGWLLLGIENTRKREIQRNCRRDQKMVEQREWGRYSMNPVKKKKMMMMAKMNPVKKKKKKKIMMAKMNPVERRRMIKLNGIKTGTNETTALRDANCNEDELNGIYVLTEYLLLLLLLKP